MQFIRFLLSSAGCKKQKCTGAFVELLHPGLASSSEPRSSAPSRDLSTPQILLHLPAACNGGGGGGGLEEEAEAAGWQQPPADGLGEQRPGRGEAARGGRGKTRPGRCFLGKSPAQCPMHGLGHHWRVTRTCQQAPWAI